ncbi:MAG: putative metal-binding motif-containing protein [Myxococcales bacterium]|nr:putative metal-binding motif-containing protein [Myxococcales bacterium]
MMRRLTWAFALAAALLVLPGNDGCVTSEPETCDGVDNDLDGNVDEDFDRDRDGYVDGAVCALSYEDGELDCNDTNPTINPDAEERCNGIDDDCDGVVDIGEDEDGDGWTTCGGDCDDTDAHANPEGEERCNGVDDDCDGTVDNGFDRDGDGYATCGGDCNDNDASAHPGATEACNGLDDNCDGKIDEGCGYRGGAIQVTTAWNTRANLDVFITEPTGETLSFQHPESTSGGVMDHAARAGCGADFTRDQIENAFWAGDRIRKGDYRVSIHYWGECEGGGATTGAVTVALSGKVLGTYNLQLNPGTRRDVLTIRVR